MDRARLTSPNTSSVSQSVKLQPLMGPATILGNIAMNFLMLIVTYMCVCIRKMINYERICNCMYISYNDAEVKQVSCFMILSTITLAHRR